MTFEVPDFALGAGRQFKISASQAAGKSSGFACPIGLALQARLKGGSLRPNAAQHWTPTFDKASTLHFAIRDCYRGLVRGDDPGELVAAEANLTHAQRRFVRHALERLTDLIPDASDDAGVEFHLVDELAIDTSVDGLAGRVSVGGRRLTSSDGTVHEVVRMRLKELRSARDDDAAWTAIAALALAYAAGVDAAARIRVSEFSLYTGEYRCVFDGSRADASVAYMREGRPLRSALSGGAFVPGSGCSGCGFLHVCPAVPKLRGVLGIPGQARATRHLTATDLDAYARCPTAFLARRDHLPDAYAQGADGEFLTGARDRGLAVHAWLSWAHSRRPAVGCSEEDLPEPSDPFARAAAATAGLELDAYRVAYPYLRQHLAVCPCGLDGLEGWRVEPRVVAFDADADMVVISTPDLTCTVTGSHDAIWRETKTAALCPPDIEAAFAKYPVFALNVALLAALASDTGSAAHAELEVLTPTEVEVFYVSLTDGALVVYAQQIVAEIARRYAEDVTFDRRVSGACRNCSAHGWCDPPPLQAFAASEPNLDEDEFADFAPPF